MENATHSAIDQAFKTSYGRNVADADDATVSLFIEYMNKDLDADEIHTKFGQQYASLMDAYCVFFDGIAFVKKIQATEFAAALSELQQATSNELVLTAGCRYKISDKLAELKGVIES